LNKIKDKLGNNVAAGGGTGGDDGGFL